MAVEGTLSHWLPAPGGEPAWRELRVADLLDEAADRWPEREAIVYSAYDDLGISERWTFPELRERSRAVARALVGAGYGIGDRLGIWATNLPEWLLVQFGAAYAGVVLVPLNPLYRASEVSYVLGKAGARGCVVEPENRGASLWAILEEAAADLPDLELRLAIGDTSGCPGPSLREWTTELAARVSEEELDARYAEVTPGHLSQIQFTSGTTGFPKGAALPNRGLANNARLFADRARLPDGGTHCNPMPFFHCGGSVMSTLGSIATGSTQLPILTFDAARVVASIDREGATSLSAVPTMLIACEDEARRTGARLDSLEIIVTGGSPVPVDVERRWIERFGVAFTITYGLTECSPVITQSSPDDPEERQIATCGIPLPHVEVDVVGPLDERVPLGEQGELRARGPMVMQGYWDDAAATATTIDPEGWLRTGDLASMDAEGYVSITGRAKEMIIRGGENIYPAEIENALRNLPGVLDAAVVGVPDERYGEQVAAFVRPEDGAALEEEALREQLAGRVARFKIPRYIDVVDEFPVTPSGKIQKFRLRELFAERRPA